MAIVGITRLIVSCCDSNTIMINVQSARGWLEDSFTDRHFSRMLSNTQGKGATVCGMSGGYNCIKSCPVEIWVK